LDTQAYFDDIQLHILHELNKAERTIHIAVAWFTDLEIFDLLCQKAQIGVRVELLIVNDAINRKSPIEYTRLSELGGLFMMVGNNKKNSAIMHNKFCIIDSVTIITGSYNWSKQAQENWENITIISDHPDLANQFLQEFESIIEHAGGKGCEGVDTGKVISRLEALRHTIDLDDDDDIDLQLNKLKKLTANRSEFDEIAPIVELVEQGRRQEAAARITTHVTARKQVVIYTDPEIPELKLELKALEFQINAMENERADIEKTLHAYHVRYNTELGDIVRRILKLRTDRLAKKAEEDKEFQQEAEEARRDFESFEEDYIDTKDQELYSISQAEQDELKALYRACSKLCHPDLVAEADKHDATNIFKKLNEANEKNDLAAIKEIYENLKNGIFSTMSATISDAIKLHKQVVKMRTMLKEAVVAIYELRKSDSWIKISAIVDWDEHFKHLREEFQKQLDELEKA
jgi:hypothetical protein